LPRTKENVIRTFEGKEGRKKEGDAMQLGRHCETSEAPAKKKGD